jgi:excisionase family DNA binding protein
MIFTLTREEAAHMLGVSTRTIDRAVQSGKIRTKREGKTIFLHRDDVENMRAQEIPVHHVPYEVIETPKPLMTPTISYDAREAQNEIMQALEMIVKQKDALIQELTFKLGKLEAEIQNTIPRLEHKKAVLALEESNIQRLQDLDKIRQAKQQFETKYQKEKLLSTILMIGVLILVVACIVLMFHFFGIRENSQI